jgi:hypothetical protein
VTAACRVSAEQLERERQIAERMRAPRPMAAYYAGRCACGARWVPGDVVFRSPVTGGPATCCLDCGLRREEGSK